jgi:hypothetical protein
MIPDEEKWLVIHVREQREVTGNIQSDDKIIEQSI